MAYGQPDGSLLLAEVYGNVEISSKKEKMKSKYNEKSKIKKFIKEKDLNLNMKSNQNLQVYTNYL